jgi:hypothetical protein
VTCDKAKEYAQYLAKRHAESLQWISCGYHCKCGADTFYVIDRYPMSPKIMFQCESCKEMSLKPIIKPYEFFNKILGYFSAEKLKDLVWSKGNQQRMFIECMLEEDV